MTFYLQDRAAPAWDATSAKGKSGNFYVPVNTPLDQKCCLSSQPIPRFQANSGLYTYFIVPSHPKEG